MARNITQISNEAISDLPAHPISDIDDTSQKEARECARHLPGVVSDLIALHDWAWVRRRIALAAVTNDRPGEWAYAYSLPSGLISAIKLVPTYSSSSVPGVVVTPTLYWGAAYSSDGMDYEIADGVLYTNLEGAVLEHSTDALEPAKWSPLFAQAVIRTLAARIYRPILGEKADTNEWLVKQQAARTAVNEAVADDLNRHPRRRRGFTSEAEIARGVDRGGIRIRGGTVSSGSSGSSSSSDYDPGDLAAIVS